MATIRSETDNVHRAVVYFNQVLRAQEHLESLKKKLNDEVFKKMTETEKRKYFEATDKILAAKNLK